MGRTFTLDRNCLIDIERNRPAATAVRMLADAHAAGTADVAVIAMAASENQRNGQLLRAFADFQGYLATLHLGHLSIVVPMMYWDISFWDHCLWSDDSVLDLERRIHSILFPNVQFLWKDYCRDNGNDPLLTAPIDQNFHRKKTGLLGLGAGHIEYPDDAGSLL